jgi:hypothetical protein
VPVTEHRLAFPDRATADEVAAELAEDGFSEVRVVRQADGWAVHVVEEMVDDESGPVEGGLRDRFRALADDRGGSYDPQPGTPA